MGYFEFLHASIITCLPLNISEKLHWQYLFEKLEEADTDRIHLCSYDTIPTHPHMPLQQGPIFYNPLKSTFSLFVAYCHHSHNRELYEGFVLPAEREL